MVNIPTRQIKERLAPVLILVAIIWVVELVNLVSGHRLTAYGIQPRTLSGLIGIPLAPFIHASLWHAISNTLPLLVLGGLTLTLKRNSFWNLTITIALVSGALVWIFARSSVHVGASGLVFGYFGALLAAAIFERSVLTIVVAIATVTLYGGLIWGVLPSRSYISFESHLFGLVAGVLTVWGMQKMRRENPPDL